MARPHRSRKRRTAIVPAVVFAITVGAACVPNLAACGDDAQVGFDLGTSDRPIGLDVAQVGFDLSNSDRPIGLDVAALDFAND